jgi:hypothetical protein
LKVILDITGQIQTTQDKVGLPAATESTVERLSRLL